jgi:HAD superfamily hydrolase (TIGR01509 family)
VSLRGLLFDLDGTLVDSDPIHYLGWRDALAPHGIALTEAEFRTRMSGRLNPAIVREFLPALTAEEGARVADAKEAGFRELARGIAPTRGLRELLALAEARGLRCALVTNAPRANALHVLSELGVTALFHGVVLAEEVGRGKPDPAPYQHALDRLGLTPEEALAFEDSPTGIASARGAGIRVVAIESGHDGAALTRAGADLVVPDFAASALAALLEGI